MTPRRVRIIIDATTDATLKRLRTMQPSVQNAVEPLIFEVQRVQVNEVVTKRPRSKSK